MCPKCNTYLTDTSTSAKGGGTYWRGVKRGGAYWRGIKGGGAYFLKRTVGGGLIGGFNLNKNLMSITA